MTTFLTEEALLQKSPQELTALLYEACLTNLEDAMEYMEKKDFIKVNEKLQKASDIIHRIGAGLNYEAGIVADQLEQVYNYIANQLVIANFTKDRAKIAEIVNILTTIMTSWNEAMKTNRDRMPNRVKQKIKVYDSYSIYE
ncbi:flagellar biosynthesis protein FliS [Halalkalibacter wakoensis JCM 9140]|uniref:Flagellar secretion chaperone FliS n=1 Tax=Halalkalibacter wakoensis JCM 9140 TaxID=1236970 RepID=W4Q0A6_9BACI|nr:flagellar export chaperone FliS [Halalkalibacter wakoensis]GAE24814.1 flagellar biosynthesis protein FliS [Halalkalibacter wakoensis JCM 9140]